MSENSTQSKQKGRIKKQKKKLKTEQQQRK